MAYYTCYLLLHTTANSFCDYYYISNLSINNLVSKMRLNLHIHTYLYLLIYSSFYKNTILFTSLFVLSSRFRKNENYDTKKTIFNFLSLISKQMSPSLVTLIFMIKTHHSSGSTIYFSEGRSLSRHKQNFCIFHVIFP